MAHARRSQHHRGPRISIHTPSTARKDTLKRVRRRSASDASPETISSPLPRRLRPPLAALQPNHRRPLYGTRSSTKDIDVEEVMREFSHVTTGSKRKRVVSGNENAHGRSTRGIKRPRVAASRIPYNLSASEESESEVEEMEVDLGSSQGTQTDDSDIPEEQDDNEDEEAEEEDEDSSDDFFIHEASQKRLSKLLKWKLVELYQLAGFTESADSLKKSELIDALIGAREDGASIPPSSPGRADASSDYQSSDDGNFAGDEETDAPARHPSDGRQLLRRVTINDMSKLTPRPKHMKNRSTSLGNVLGNGQSSKTFVGDPFIADELPARRRSSTRSSPSTSGTTSSRNQSPPHTRLRSRTASETHHDTSLPNSSSSKTKGKGKSKQVEFSDAIEVHLRTPPKQNSKGKKKELSFDDSDSELTSLDELEGNASNGEPSPRRLRSQDREDRSVRKETIDVDKTPVANSKRQRATSKAESDRGSAESSTSRKTRITPMRRAKRKIGNLRESDQDEEVTEEEDLLPEVGEEDNEEEDAEEEEEVDELISSRSTSRSMSPQPQLKKPRRARRKRPRRAKALPTGDEENEGDDEEEVIEEEGDEEALEEVDEEVEEDQEGDDEDEEATIAVEPRKLRNGKIVGEEADEEEGEEEEEVDEMDVDESVGEEEEGDEEGEEVDTESVEGSEIDVDGEVAEEVMEDDDIDLTIATAKTLVRLRRDDLVRLCESRAIDASGTKPQLADALLQWRDRQTDDLSSPSSTGTVRPWSNRRKKKTRKDSSTTTTNSDVPVLLRSEHVHTDEPRTPVPSKEKDSEDLELDLESLGLEDREIPPDKLTKLEKIGSGGFKDVFIGKFKGRKIAIAEFRGQLSAMDIKELKLLGEFNHPNIVRFMGVSIPENTRETPVMIISELCSNGDLFDYIRNVPAPSLRKVLKLMLDVARGLEYLHKRTPSVIHRDCKSSNILITARGSAKIADFGLAKVKQSTRSMVRSLVGTVNWQAPELWNAHPKYNHKVDVFSCAMVFWEMLQWHQSSKKFPWEGMNEHAIYDLVGAKRQRPSMSGLKKHWCPDIVELVERMWAQEHQDRPTMSDVVETLEDIYARY